MRTLIYSLTIAAIANFVIIPVYASDNCSTNRTILDALKLQFSHLNNIHKHLTADEYDKIREDNISVINAIYDCNNDEQKELFSQQTASGDSDPPIAHCSGLIRGLKDIRETANSITNNRAKSIVYISALNIYETNTADALEECSVIAAQQECGKAICSK